MLYDKNQLENTINFAVDYIRNYNANYNISPFRYIENDARAKNKQDIYIECVDFLQTLDNLTQDHIKRRNKIIYTQ